MSDSKTRSDADRAVRQISVQRVAGDQSFRDVDTVAVEEPLAITLQHWFKSKQQTESLALTMRTPGHDRELAAGFLFGEGLVHDRLDFEEIRSLGTDSVPSNEILVSTRPGVDIAMGHLSRSTFVNSSCGICGKRSIAAVEERAAELSGDVRFSASLLRCLPELLRASQEGFAQTGGLHAAARIDEHGNLLAAFEDVGRHNALDKLIGDALLKNRVPLTREILFLSSRGSFELVQKAVLAGAPVLACVGSPSSLAVETATRFGLTLAGFVRGERFNLYSGEWRIHS